MRKSKILNLKYEFTFLIRLHICGKRGEMYMLTLKVRTDILALWTFMIIS